jgi:hypothetical protein
VANESITIRNMIEGARAPTAGAPRNTHGPRRLPPPPLAPRGAPAPLAPWPAPSPRSPFHPNPPHQPHPPKPPTKPLPPDTGTDEVIPLPNVNGKILAKVIEYCAYHVEAATKGPDDKPKKSEDEVKSWDTDFVKVDQATLFDLILVGGL